MNKKKEEKYSKYFKCLLQLVWFKSSGISRLGDDAANIFWKFEIFQ